MNKAFVEMNETVQDTSVMSDEAKSSVNESLDAGVQEINYTQFHEQVWVINGMVIDGQIERQIAEEVDGKEYCL